jgi:hypothetical protein
MLRAFTNDLMLLSARCSAAMLYLDIQVSYYE